MTGWLFKARAALFSIEQLAADQLQVKTQKLDSETVHRNQHPFVEILPLNVSRSEFSKLAKLADQTVNETGSVPSRSEKKGRGNIFWRAGRGSVLSLVQLSNQRAVHLTKFILCSAICYLRRQIIYFQRSLQL
ncbi:hypothetical protein T4D_16275 [Trichinella pseudospiralis]|uniref:Uncharacterized protein n=1 Tax=Trichinella pseudospiralis TaxID=6337 RepID=A0A0V1FHF5_TRIPS|nr:hypothetical protein T4D_16275 [Trichinella pseudospiralis]